MKNIKLIFLLMLAALFLTACRTQPEPEKASFFAMDTYMTITAYGENADAAIKKAAGKISELEKLWSVTDENSEVYKINHSNGNTVEISWETYELLELMHNISYSTGGALDCTLYPVLTAWGFTTGEYNIPSEEQLSELLSRTGWEKVITDATYQSIPERQYVTVPENMQIDLGSAGKGMAGMIAADILKESGVGSALLDLGGNIQTIGTKPDGSDWRLGIRSPFDEGMIGVLEVSDCAVITSGGYERYFIGDDGETYWHILDPKTGRPARSGLASATIVGERGDLCDALSTAVFIMGAEKAEELWRKRKDFEMILVTDDGDIIITGALEKRFSLSGAYGDIDISVIS